MLNETQSTDQIPSTAFYITGGTLRGDAACYVRRQADESLFESLSQGQFCYVLTSRQMGKSSLMIRTAEQLRESGAGVVVLDLTAVGQNLTAEQWYDGLLNRIGRQLQLEDELESFWLANPRLGPLQRWMNAITEVVLPRYPGKLVIFIDEIDTVRSLPFTTDEFFAGIREFYNRRTSEPDLERLTFCLLGVASPSDLIRDTRMTPFNIGLRIELNDFTEEEAAPLAQGLGLDDQAGLKLLKRVLFWTGGHPYLTQRLCLAVSKDKNADDAQSVDRLCDEIFFNRKAQDGDDNLVFVRERLLRSDVDLAGLLTLYDRVHSGKNVADDETSPLVTALHLSGITRVENGRLKVRNQIYERVFDRDWVKEHMPDAELRRQQAAYRKGLMRAAAVAFVIVLVIATLAIIANQQRNQADQQRVRAETQEEINRRQLYAAQMNLAMQAWEDAGIITMSELLNNHIPKPGQKDLRGFEWYYLNGLLNSDLRSIRHGNTIWSVKFLPDNRRIATASDDGAIKIWDIVTGKELMKFKGHLEDVTAIAVSPDGLTLVSGGLDKTVRLWSLSTGQEILTFNGHNANVNNITFSHDGKKVASASDDKTVRIWDLKKKTEQSILLHDEPAMGVSFSPDDNRLATASMDGFAHIWDIATGKEKLAFKAHQSGAFTVEFSPEGSILVTGGGDRTAKFWYTSTGAPVMLPGVNHGQPTKKIIKEGHVINLAFSSSGKMMAIALYNRLVKIYSFPALELLNTYKGHNSSLNSVAFSPNEKMLVSAGRDGIARVWDMNANQNTSLPDTDLCFGAAFSPDGCCLAVGNSSPIGASLWNIKTHERMKIFRGKTADTVISLTFSPDGHRLATGGLNKIVQIWNVGTGQEIFSLKGHTGMIISSSFSPNGQILATGSYDSTVRLWDATSGREIEVIGGYNGPACAVAFSPDGQRLATGSFDTKIKLLNAKNWKEEYTIKLQHIPLSFAFSPNGNILAASTSGGTVKLLDLTTKKEVSLLKGHVGDIYFVIFSPDGRRVITGGSDGYIKFWDIATRQEVFSVKYKYKLTALALSPDGKTLASADETSLRLWNADENRNSVESKAKKILELSGTLRNS